MLLLYWGYDWQIFDLVKATSTLMLFKSEGRYLHAAFAFRCN